MTGGEKPSCEILSTASIVAATITARSRSSQSHSIGFARRFDGYMYIAFPFFFCYFITAATVLVRLITDCVVYIAPMIFALVPVSMPN